MGGERHGLRVGEWRWWRKDGSLWAICRFDDRGRLHGLTERFHKSGEAASLVPYQRDHWHGKSICLRATRGPQEENVKEILADTRGVWRVEMVHVRGKLRDERTFYNKKGLTQPIASDGAGRSIDLGSQLHRLLPDTALAPVARLVQPIAGPALELLASAGWKYEGLALVRGTIHRLSYRAKRRREMTVVEAQEIGRAFGLAVDRIAAGI